MKQIFISLLLCISLLFAEKTNDSADNSVQTEMSDSIILCELPSLNNETTIEKMIGRYRGIIESGGSTLPAITTLSGSGNNLRGTYACEEEFRRVKGRLSDFELTDSHTLRCRWKDLYGSGTLVIQFDDTYSKFAGQWLADSHEDRMLWNGTKQ